MANEMTKTQKDFRFICLLLVNRRMTVARMADELNMTKRSVYRLVRDCSACMPIRLENGVIIRTAPTIVETTEG